MSLNPLRLARLQLDLPLWQVARRVGISDSQLSRIERGHIKPTREILVRIYETLGVPVPVEDNEKNETGSGNNPDAR